MKKLLLLLATCVAILVVSCNKEEKDKPIPKAEVESLSNIDVQYSRGLHEILQIKPTIKYSTKNLESIQYEWNIDSKKVGQDSILNYKCEAIGTFDGYFKVTSDTGAKIHKFQLIVDSPYSNGLILMTETSEGAILSWKRLDKMEAPVSINAFKDNNPTLSLGKKAKDIIWYGESRTNLIQKNNSNLDIIVATSEPTKIYSLNTDNLQVKNEISTNLNDIQYVLRPFGVDNSLWDSNLYIYSGGNEYGVSKDKQIVKTKFDDEIRIGGVTSLITDNTDMVIAYYNQATSKFVYNSGLMGPQLGSFVFNAEDVKIVPSDGVYRTDESSDYRIEPGKLIAWGKSGAEYKMVKIIPADIALDETVEKEISLGDKVDALIASPSKPICYFSKGNAIYTVNTDNGKISSMPILQLKGNIVIKAMTFNQYDENTLYVAGEDKDIKDDLKAVVYVVDVKNETTGNILFEGHNAGGNIVKLIYKGTGRENLDRHKKLS